MGVLLCDRGEKIEWEEERGEEDWRMGGRRDKIEGGGVCISKYK